MAVALTELSLYMSLAGILILGEGCDELTTVVFLVAGRVGHDALR